MKNIKIESLRTIAASLFFFFIGLAACGSESVKKNEDGPVVTSQAQAVSPLSVEVDRLAEEVESRMIEWRRDFHTYPELSNREFRTSKIVAEHLQNIGLEVKTGIAHTGVVGILRGRKDSPVVALRADMDALPVTELADVPFASKNEGVMHACGHDTHMAMLMAVAEVLSKMRDRLPGTVKFIFQPAEEGAPQGEEGGAALMIKEGVLQSPEPDAIFGLHVYPMVSGSLSFRPGGMMASADTFRIVVKGTGAHGGMPWHGVDPIVVSSQIIMGLQTIVSRQTDLTETPAVVTVGMIRGGTRNNIIPPEVEMEGTIRTFDPAIRKDIHERIKKTASAIAESAGASAEVEVNLGVPVTSNNPGLTVRMTPTLERVAGKEKIMAMNPITGAEDFAFYVEKIPGLYVFLGTTPPGTEPIPNHSPYFLVDESALIVGVRVTANLAIDFLEAGF
jgi:amidohydrolase